MGKKLIIPLLLTALVFTLSITYAKNTGKEIRTVVIDPGFGGKDTGPIGRKGLKAKDVNLDIARRLEKLFTQQSEIKVVLTRTADYFVPLKERIAIANNNKADLFISIHTNAALNPKASGFETYFSSLPLTQKAEAITDTKKCLKYEELILWDIAQNKIFIQSAKLAELVQKELGKRLKTKNRGLKQSSFHVLKGVNRPSALVAVGFITNSVEEQRLSDPKFRQRVAQALFEAVQTYVKEELKSKGK